MPFKDPERKREYMRRYRKNSISNGYGRWLYQRRALRYADADFFRAALEKIEARPEYSDTYKIAHAALKASDRRWKGLGPSPRSGLGQQEPTMPDDTLFEALERLGLSSSRR